MSEWFDAALANRLGRDRRPLLKVALLGSPAVAASQHIRPNGDIARAVPVALRDDAEDGRDADAVARVRRALQARGLVLTGTFRAPAHQATRYGDRRAYQAYVDEMVCLP